MPDVRWPVAFTALLLLWGCAPGQRAATPAGESIPVRAAVQAPEAGEVPPAERMRMHVIDVGQGAATLFEFPCGAILVDTGGEENAGFHSTARLRDYLDAFFQRRPDLNGILDLLVLTHPHIDHTRGVRMVLERYRPRRVVDDGIDDPDLTGRGSGLSGQLAMHRWASENGVPYEGIRLDTLPFPGGLSDGTLDPLDCGTVDPRIRAFFGFIPPALRPSGWSEDDYEDENNHSVVLRIDFGAFSALVTGDLEKPAVAELLARTAGSDALDVDLLEVGHHGSDNATTPALLQAVTPEAAIISAGNPLRHGTFSAWAYGHPRVATIDALENLSYGVSDTRPPVQVPVAVSAKHFEDREIRSAIYNTGWDGTIIVTARSDGSYFVQTLPE